MTLPQFDVSFPEALDAGRRAETCGLDGLFAFDHLWPIGQKGRSALSCLPLLAAIAASTRRIAVGPLVARIGLLPDEVLLGEIDGLCRIAPGRVVAGLGIGDAKSAAENIDCGIGIPARESRLASLERCARDLVAAGVPVWLGGYSDELAAIAASTGSALNVWEAGAVEVERRVAEGLEVSWGGPLRGPEDETASRVDALDSAGASWMVWGWPPSPETVAAARDRRARSTR